MVTNIVFDILNSVINITSTSVTNQVYDIEVTRPDGAIVVESIADGSAGDKIGSVVIPSSNGVLMEGAWGFKMINQSNLLSTEVVDESVSLSLLSLVTELTFDCKNQKGWFKDKTVYPSGTTFPSNKTYTVLPPNIENVVTSIITSSSDIEFVITHSNVNYQGSLSSSPRWQIGGSDGNGIFVEQTIYSTETKKVSCHDLLCEVKGCITKFFDNIKKKVKAAGDFDFIPSNYKTDFINLTILLNNYTVADECNDLSSKEKYYEEIKKIVDCGCDCCDEADFPILLGEGGFLDVVSGNDYITRTEADGIITLTFNESELPVVSLTAGTGITISDDGAGRFTINSSLTTHDPVTLGTQDNRAALVLTGQELTIDFNYRASVVSNPSVGVGYLSVSGDAEAIPAVFNVTLKDSGDILWGAEAEVDNIIMGQGTYRKIGQVVQFTRRVEATALGLKPINKDWAGFFPLNFRPVLETNAMIVAHDAVTGNFLGVAGVATIFQNGNVETRFGGSFDFANAPINQVYEINGSFVSNE